MGSGRDGQKAGRFLSLRLISFQEGVTKCCLYAKLFPEPHFHIVSCSFAAYPFLLLTCVHVICVKIGLKIMYM
jgi:hypothetical protein